MNEISYNDICQYKIPMIQASELRIGNWVLIKNKPTSITSLNGYGIELEADHYGNAEPEYYFTSGSIKPIPITPEILEMIGFEKAVIKGKVCEYNLPCTPANYKNEYWLSWTNFESLGTKGRIKWMPVWGGDSHSFPCEYLHQLQNLYVALTGTELQLI